MIIHSLVTNKTVPEFNLAPLAITVTEGNVSEVEFCITLDDSIDRNVVVSAETGPKDGAANQAIG